MPAAEDGYRNALVNFAQVKGIEDGLCVADVCLAELVQGLVVGCLNGDIFRILGQSSGVLHQFLFQYVRLANGLVQYLADG